MSERADAGNGAWRWASWLLLALAAAPLLGGACRPPEAAAPPARAPSASASAAPAASCEPRAVASYEPLPGPSVTATLPPPPALPERPERVGEDFTVWGIKKALRSPGGIEQLKGREVTVVGVVVATNFAAAPACALHPIGRADPEGCLAPVPAFFLADEPGETRYRLKVIGFASRWSTLVAAEAREKARQQGPFADPLWARPVPLPLPAPGARVKVRGTMGFIFRPSPSVGEFDASGLFTYRESWLLGPAPQPAVLGTRRPPG